VRIVVFGPNGQLGAAIVEACGSRHEVIAYGHEAVDIIDDRAVRSAIEAARPDAVVNCAAYNNVDGAEDHPVDALNANALGVRSLARAAASAGAALVHYSTDFVFDGTATVPYTESDAPNPRSVYAVSKLLGEWFASDARAYVLRVESLFGRASIGPPAKGSVAAIVNALLEGRDARVFEDRIVSPTYVIDAARATLWLLEHAAPPGLYHCVNSGHCTWLELARELADQLNESRRLVPVRMADVQLRAERPQYCALSNDKLRAAGFEMPTWRDAVVRYARDERSRHREARPV